MKLPTGAQRLQGALAMGVLWGLGVAACDRPTPSEKATRVTVVESGARLVQPIERWLEAGQTLRFEISLAPGQFLDARVEQRGLDIKVEVVDPVGSVLLRVDRSDGAEGAEEVCFVARNGGRYAFEISAFDPQRAGTIELRVVALRAASESDLERSQASASYSRARDLDRQGASAAEILPHYQAAATLWNRLGDPEREAWAIFFAGKIEAHDRERLPSAIETFRHAIDRFLVARQDHLAAIVLHDLGVAYRRMGDRDGEAKAYERAIALLDRPEDLGDRAARTNDLALVRIAQQRLAEAFQLFATALRDFEAEGDVSELARVHFNRGTLHALVGSWRKALDDHLYALSLLDQQDDPTLRAQLLTRLGDEFLDLGDPDAAMVRLRQAVALRRRILAEKNDEAAENGVAVSLTSLGFALLERQQPNDALDALLQAAQIFERLERLDSLAAVLNHLGRAYERLGRTERARRYYERALSLSAHDRQGQIESVAAFGLARTARREGRFDDAERWIARSLARVEGLSSRLPTPELRGTLILDREEQYDFLVDLLATREANTPGRGFAERAFAAHERAEARVLVELLAEGHGPRNKDSIERLAALRRTINQGHLERIERPRNRRSLEPSAAEVALDQQLSDYAQAASPLDGQTRYLPPIPPLATGVRDLLDDETLLLEFHLGRERSYLWAVTRSERRLVGLPPRTQIDGLADRVYERFSQSQFELDQVAAFQAAARLSRTLLAPVADLLRVKRRLVVVASGSLARVPFAALPRPQAVHGSVEITSSRPLILDHEVIHLPSVTILSLLRGRAARAKPSGLLAVIGDPVFDRDDPRWQAKKSVPAARERTAAPLPWPRLEFTLREARKILDIAPKEGVLGAIGFDANRSLFESGRLGDFRILHFATHGLFDDTSPQLSALALSAWDSQGRPLDGLLRAYELAQSTLRADLVVASACRTGLNGDSALGQGGLTQAFLRAGAQRVIVSLWDADDRATSELMSRFYRGLLVDRLTPSQALRRAQISLLAEPRWAAPYFWGSFVIEGDWI